ncbi:histidine kinase [Streptomyces olivoreticuli]
MKPRSVAARLLALLLLLVPVAAAADEGWSQAGDADPLPLDQLTVLLLRRRLPFTTLLATLPALYSGGYIAPLVALYAVALRYGKGWLPAAGTALFVLTTAVSPNGPEITGRWIHDLVPIMTEAGLITAALAMGLLLRTRAELTDRLADLAEAREREDHLLAQQVLTAERARLAREMHDVVAHQVSLISVQIGALQVTTTDPGVRETARSTRRLAARTLDELRQMVGILRASGGTFDTLAPQPLLGDLPSLIAGSGLGAEPILEVSLAPPPANSWSEAVQRAAYRTVQEALTNIRKHAPAARTRVHLYEQDHQLHVEVRNGPPDPGTPSPELISGGHGLTGLRERAHLLGGTFHAHPTDDGGFLLHAAFPAQQQRPTPPA